MPPLDRAAWTAVRTTHAKTRTTRTVDQLRAVVHNPLDLAIPLQVSDRYPRERAVDLHSVNERRLRDHLEGGDLLQDLVVGWLVEDDGILCLHAD